MFQFQRISVPWSGMGTMFDEGLFSVGARGRMLTCSPVAKLRRRGSGPNGSLCRSTALYLAVKPIPNGERSREQLPEQTLTA